MDEISGEKLNTEYKQEYVSDIKKEVIAFANAERGTVFVGICNKGSSSQPMTEEGIREMLLQNSGRSFELCRSMTQELTFREFYREMELRGFEIGDAQMRTLKLIGEDGLYTNLALLLSDQCEVTTKIALFQGRDKETFRVRTD